MEGNYRRGLFGVKEPVPISLGMVGSKRSHGTMEEDQGSQISSKGNMPDKDKTADFADRECKYAGTMTEDKERCSRHLGLGLSGRTPSRGQSNVFAEIRTDIQNSMTQKVPEFVQQPKSLLTSGQDSIKMESRLMVGASNSHKLGHRMSKGKIIPMPLDLANKTFKKTKTQQLPLKAFLR